MPEALLTQHRVQPGSAASRAHFVHHRSGCPCLPRPCPAGLLLVLASQPHCTAGSFPSSFPWHLCVPQVPINAGLQLAMCLWRAALLSSTPLEEQTPGLALTHMFFQGLPSSLPRFPGALCAARGTAECVWCYCPEGQSCHRLPAALQHLQLGGPGCPTARCTHSSCLWCPHLPAGILGELVLEASPKAASPKAASGHLAPLGCANRPRMADRLHSGLLDVVLFSVNPRWPIPTTYLLSCAQIIALDVSEDGHKSSFSRSQETSVSCSPSKAADSDWPPLLQVVCRTWQLASSIALYQDK